MDHLWRHGKERICANRQYASIEEQVHRFLHYLKGLSVEETLQKAGVLSEDYWLKTESWDKHSDDLLSHGWYVQRPSTAKAKQGNQLGPTNFAQASPWQLFVLD